MRLNVWNEREREKGRSARMGIQEMMKKGGRIVAKEKKKERRKKEKKKKRIVSCLRPKCHSHTQHLSQKNFFRLPVGGQGQQ